MVDPVETPDSGVSTVTLYNVFSLCYAMLGVSKIWGLMPHPPLLQLAGHVRAKDHALSLSGLLCNIWSLQFKWCGGM